MTATTKPKRKRGRPAKPNSARLELRFTTEQKEAWSEIALLEGFQKAGSANLSGWLKGLADSRVEQVNAMQPEQFNQGSE